MDAPVLSDLSKSKIGFHKVGKRQPSKIYSIYFTKRVVSFPLQKHFNFRFLHNHNTLFSEEQA